MTRTDKKFEKRWLRNFFKRHVIDRNHAYGHLFTGRRIATKPLGNHRGRLIRKVEQ